MHAVAEPTQHQLYVAGAEHRSHPRFVAVQGLTNRLLAAHLLWLVAHDKQVALLMA